MTEAQIELYKKTKDRLRRLGKENPADVIVALAEEIEYYRNKIRAMEELLDQKTIERTNKMSIVEELRTKKSEYNRRLLDRAADRIEELEAENRALIKLIEQIADSEINFLTELRETISTLNESEG